MTDGVDRQRSPFIARLREGVTLTQITDRIWSVLPTEKQRGPYHRLAAAYDWVIASRWFSPIFWGCPRSAYADAVATALASTPEGLLLDCPCGSMAFSSKAYSARDLDRAILFDRTLAMMERAATRTDASVFLQGDAFDLPFHDEEFAGVMSWGLLHVVGTTGELISSFQRVTRPGGVFSMYTLVRAERRGGNFMLGLLRRIGHAVAPETADHVRTVVGQYFTIETSEQRGNMLFLTARR